MKKIILLVSLTLPNFMFAQNVQNFIDFNNFEQRIQQVYTNETNELVTINGRSIARIGSEMFQLDNWNILMTNSSGENPISVRDSYTRRVTSEEQGTVLGTRVLFPEWPHAGEAVIQPIFRLLPFTQDGQYAHINNGVVTNVGSIKRFSLWANGRNFAYTLGFRVRDLVGNITEFPLGSLFYIGWRQLIYENPFFSDRIPNNIEPAKRVYPSEVPLLVFDSIVLYRPDNQAGGNFVGYFGKSDIEYTPYLTQMPTDIVDEQIWGIIADEQKKLAAAINKNVYSELLEYEYARQRLQAINGTNDSQYADDPNTQNNNDNNNNNNAN